MESQKKNDGPTRNKEEGGPDTAVLAMEELARGAGRRFKLGSGSLSYVLTEHRETMMVAIDKLQKLVQIVTKRI